MWNSQSVDVADPFNVAWSGPLAAGAALAAPGMNAGGAGRGAARSASLRRCAASSGADVALNGVGPEDLRIAELETRLATEPVKEIILALGTDVEGDATGHYLAKRLAPRGVKVSRLAHGLPAGSGLEFADELTLSRALEGRTGL